MGQARNVLVFRLLCENCIDERIMEILENKQMLFDNFADVSVAGQESIQITEKMSASIIESERKRLSIID